MSILHAAFVNQRHPSQVQGSKVALAGRSGVERICMALNQTASQMSDIGGVMGELLPSVNYPKTVSTQFEPQLTLLSSDEINFPKKKLYLNTLEAYKDSLEEAGRELSQEIVQIRDHIRFTITDIGKAEGALKLAQASLQRWNKWRTETAVNDMLLAIDFSLETLTKALNKIIVQLNSTDQDRFVYLQDHLEVRESLQAAIDQRGY